MGNLGDTALRKAFRDFLGVEAFNRFCEVLLQKNRLMFWQEQLVAEFCSQSELEIPADIDVLRKMFIEVSNPKDNLKSFKKILEEKREDWTAVKYVCSEDPTLFLQLTFCYNYFVSGLGRQLGSTSWRIFRGERVIFEGREEVPIGDWVRLPRSWKEQVETCIGRISVS